MSSKSPWSVKGVSAEDREAAKVAARKAGIPIGVWLSEQIRHASSDGPAQEGRMEPSSEPSTSAPQESPEMGHEGNAPEAHPHPRAMPDRQRGGQVDPRFAFGRGQWSVAEEAVDGGVVANASAGYPWQFRSMAPQASHAAPVPAAQGNYLAPIPQAPAPVPAVVPGADAGEMQALEKRIAALESSLQDLSDRVAEVEGRTLDRLEPILSKIERLNGDVARLEKAGPSELVNDSGFSTAPIERAVMRLSERLGRVERFVLPGQKSRRGFFSRLFRRG